jgi:uncharacterized phiE125 gp8 family phage protein
MIIKTTTPPAIEPVDLATARLFLKVDSTTDDALISLLIASARAATEEFTGRAIITRTLTAQMRHPPITFSLPCPPMLEIDSIIAIDNQGIEREIDPCEYMIDFDNNSTRVIAPDGWGLQPDEKLLITWQAGYGSSTDDYPPAIQTAMLMMIARWYENREVTAPTDDIKRLLLPWRVRLF